MTLLLDAGAFFAIERGDRELAVLLKRELLEDRAPMTHGGVIAQVWRGGARQANVARFLPAVDVVPLDETLGREVGVLLGRNGTNDVVDAGLAALARDGDTLLTSDVEDLVALSRTARLRVDVVGI